LSRRRGSRRARRPVRRWLVRLVAAFAGATVLPIACVRWVDPPVSALMLERYFAAREAGRAYWPSQRWVPLERVSPALRLAVVAAEDQRFPDHRGFDLHSIADALEEAGSGARLRGASTITQQVCKNLFLWPGRSWLRKGLEAWLTVVVEVAWPKRRILEVYLNVAELGEGVFGVEAASRRFFGRSAAAIGDREAALLAAALPNPVRLSLDPPGPEVERRAERVREQMAILGRDHLAARGL
jgi:monofunctional biosynthetic peptidoglycan transglycosylase